MLVTALVEGTALVLDPCQWNVYGFWQKPKIEFSPLQEQEPSGVHAIVKHIYIHHYCQYSDHLEHSGCAFLVVHGAIHSVKKISFLRFSSTQILISLNHMVLPFIATPGLNKAHNNDPTQLVQLSQSYWSPELLSPFLGKPILSSSCW